MKLQQNELQFLLHLVETYKSANASSSHPDEIVLHEYYEKMNQAFMQRIIDKLEILILQQ
jgi:hypothetical protein